MLLPDSTPTVRHTPDEPPPQDVAVRFGFRFPYSGDKEFTGVVRGKAVWSTNGKVKLTRLASPRLLWWELVD